MKTYNTNPYYDDFDDSKGFHQILFKPGEAVQSRELTQLQTIIRSQIEKFGNHIFKHGSLVIPGNSFVEDSVPYIKIQNTIPDASYLIGKKLTQSGGTISAIVKAIEPATATSNYITLYLSYISGSGTTGSNEFSAGVISVDASYSSLPNNSPIALDTLPTNFTGTGSLASVNDGVYYVNGVFAKVNKQTIVIGKDVVELSCRVALKIIETVVGADTDASLLDPAQGSYNFAAPGADRVKIDLQLVKLNIDAIVTDDYVELMRYRDGVLEEHTRYAKYSELEKSLARRTADESGDYTVNGLNVSTQEHLRTGYNDGLFTPTDGGDADKAVVIVSPGKAYIQGYEVDKIGHTKLVTDKGNDNSHILSDGKLIMPSGAPSYIYVTIDGQMFPNLQNFNSNLELYDGNNTDIGHLTATGFEEETEGVYRMYFTGLSLSSGSIISSVSTIRLGIFVVGKVVSKITATNITGVIPAGTPLTVAASTRAATVVFHSASNPNVLWVSKSGVLQSPIGGDYFTAGTNTGTVTSITTIVTNTATSIYRVPGKIASFESSTGSYDVSYNALYFGTSTTTTPMSIPTGTGVLEYDASYTPRAPINAASVLHPDGVTISNSIEDVSYSVSVRKTNVRPKLKTKATATQVIAAFSFTTPIGTKIQLSNVDGLSLTSVTYTQGTTVVDITSSFAFSGGQTDELYDYSSLNYLGGLPAALADITVAYEYFGHIDGHSDYFCIDSYPQEFIDKSVTYVASTGESYDLLNCLDFRKSMANQSTITETAKFTQLNPDSFITASFNYYVPRVDNVYLTKNGEVVLQKGTPANKPKAPALPNDVLSIASIYVPGNSKFSSEFKIKRTKNRRYTMSDIRKLETRVNNIEKFSTLNAIENSLLNYDIVDSATGLNRFKTGYLVDNFSNAMGVCDYFAPLNRCNVNQRRLSCAIEAHESPLAVMDLSSSDYQNTGGMITAKYTERALINQNTSTRITNLNPFMVFNWEGSMTIQPSVDSWVEVEDLPTIFNTREEVITVVRQEFVERTETVFNFIEPQIFLPPAGSNPGFNPQPVFGPPPIVTPIVEFFPISTGLPPTPAPVPTPVIPPGSFESAVFPGLIITPSTDETTPTNNFQSIVAVTPIVQEIVTPAPQTFISDGEGGEWSTADWTTNNRGQIVPITINNWDPTGWVGID